MLDLFKDLRKRKQNQRQVLPFAVNVILNLSNVGVLTIASQLASLKNTSG